MRDDSKSPEPFVVKAARMWAQDHRDTMLKVGAGLVLVGIGLAKIGQRITRGL